MRRLVPFAAFLVLSLTLKPVRALSADNNPPDQQSIEALEAKAGQAEPREQCFLYAQLVHQMTELSIRQYQSGEVTKATGLLKHIQNVAQKIHLSVGNNDKRLKNVEILLSRTAFRLNEMLKATSIEDQPLVKQTLAQVNDAQNAAMMDVFQK